jgi:hypothetical protein
MDYRVISANDVDTLAERVRDAIKHGWSPSGGIAAAIYPGSYLTGMSFWQAMTKPQEKSLDDRLSYVVPAGVPTDYTKANTFQKIY